MRLRPAVVTTALFIFLSAWATSQPAQADPSPTPSPSSTSDAYKSTQDLYKIDRQNFIQAMRERDIKMRVINSIFKGAIEKAYTDARIAMTSAVTPEQKNLIAANRRNAIALAITARDAAILALGPIPTPPAKPEKNGFEKSDQKTEGKSKSKR